MVRYRIDSRTTVRAQRRPRGFTAVEITMVAAIIAILTLIALPMFHKQVEKARLHACLDEMRTLANAQDLAHAETGYYFRLNDLDNTTFFSTQPQPLEMGVPFSIWNRELVLEVGGVYEWQEHWRLAISKAAWNGPYCRFPRSIYMRGTNSLVTTFDPLLFRYESTLNADLTPNITSGRGPILILEPPFPEDEDPGEDRYPLDPWGNPYIFFGPGQMIPGDSTFESYQKSVIVSMGPNGLPGDGVNVVQASYWREGPPAASNARLGQTAEEDNDTDDDVIADDLRYEF